MCRANVEPRTPPNKRKVVARPMNGQAVIVGVFLIFETLAIGHLEQILTSTKIHTFDEYRECGAKK